jgi:hypothetical protein
VHGPQPARELPGQRRLRQPQQRETADEHRRERQGALSARFDDRVVGGAGLEQQAIVALTDGGLHQPAGVALPLVLVLGEVADLRDRLAAGREHGELVLRELELLTDERRVV